MPETRSTTTHRAIPENRKIFLISVIDVNFLSLFFL
jgi:hypothetical protein